MSGFSLRGRSRWGGSGGLCEAYEDADGVGGLREKPFEVYDDVVGFELIDGAPATSSFTGTLATGRSHLHQMPVHDGVMYALSGKAEDGESVGVELGRLVFPDL